MSMSDSCVQRRAGGDLNRAAVMKQGCGVLARRGGEEWRSGEVRQEMEQTNMQSSFSFRGD